MTSIVGFSYSFISLPPLLAGNGFAPEKLHSIPKNERNGPLFLDILYQQHGFLSIVLFEINKKDVNATGSTGMFSVLRGKPFQTRGGLLQNRLRLRIGDPHIPGKKERAARRQRHAFRGKQRTAERRVV